MNKTQNLETMTELKVNFETRTLNNVHRSNAIVRGTDIHDAFKKLNFIVSNKTSVKNFITMYYTVTYQDEGRWVKNPRVEVKGESRQALERKKLDAKESVKSNMYFKDGKFRSLSLTPARYNKYSKILDGPITKKESSIVKSILLRKTMTPEQLETIEDIYAKVNRRVPLL